MKIIELNQKSDAWLAWRNSGIGGSDAPIIMGQSPWKSAYQLWLEKTGQAERPTPNPYAQKAMDRGNALEPIARERVEDMMGILFDPICIEGNPSWMKLSSDGIDFSGTKVLEIKCPGGRDHATAVQGKIPDKYRDQLQHTLAVTHAEVCFYASYRPEEQENPIIIEVLPDRERIELLKEREAKFWEAVSKRDYGIFEESSQDDAPEGFAALARQWILLQEELEHMGSEQKSLQDQLLKIAGGEIRACGLEIVQTKRRGTIDYTAAFKALGIDPDSMEPFRKPDVLGVKVQRLGGH
jgi:putative phage-type endonuclease